MIKDYVRIAFRNISRRRLRSWLTIIGVFIGIAAVVTLIGLGEGLRSSISNQFSFLPNDVITITAGSFGMLPPGSTEATDPLDRHDVDKISQVRGIDFAMGRITNFGTIEYNNKQISTMLASIPPGKDADRFREAMNFNIEYGRFFSESDSGVIIIGHNVAEEDFWDRPLRLGERLEIEGRQFKVIGILEKKGSFIFDNIFVMPEIDQRDLFDRNDDNYDLVVAKMAAGEDIEKVTESLEVQLRKLRDVKLGEEDFTVETAQATLGQVNTILLGVQIFVIIISSISLLVGGIGIMNTMYTSVLERTKEIGIMKAIGGTRRIIFIIYTIESGFIGAVGGIGGALIGFSVAQGLSFVMREIVGMQLFTAKISLGLILGSVAFSFVLGTMFGILPSMRAMKLQPVKALSYRN